MNAETSEELILQNLATALDSDLAWIERKQAAAAIFEESTRFNKWASEKHHAARMAVGKCPCCPVDMAASFCLLSPFRQGGIMKSYAWPIPPADDDKTSLYLATLPDELSRIRFSAAVAGWMRLNVEETSVIRKFLQTVMNSGGWPTYKELRAS